MQIVGIFGDVAITGGGDGGSIISLRVHPVYRELWVMPVQERVVEPNAQALGPESVDDRSQQVPAGRGVGRLVVRKARIPQAKALMVLGRDDDVLHPRPSGVAGQTSGSNKSGSKCLK